MIPKYFAMCSRPCFKPVDIREERIIEVIPESRLLTIVESLATPQIIQPGREDSNAYGYSALRRRFAASQSTASSSPAAYLSLVSAKA